MTVSVIAFSHPTADDRAVHDLLWTKAAEAAARSGREPDEMTAHDARPTDDGFVEHRALFSCKETR